MPFFKPFYEWRFWLALFTAPLFGSCLAFLLFLVTGIAMGIFEPSLGMMALGALAVLAVNFDFWLPILLALLACAFFFGFLCHPILRRWHLYSSIPYAAFGALLGLPIIPHIGTGLGITMWPIWAIMTCAVFGSTAAMFGFMANETIVKERRLARKKQTTHLA